MNRVLLLVFAVGAVVGCSQSPGLREPVGGAADVAGGEAPVDANLRPVVQVSSGGAAASAGHVHGGAVRYTCSMHPQIDLDAPGKCPICGMALVVKATATTKGAP